MRKSPDLFLTTAPALCLTAVFAAGIAIRLHHLALGWLLVLEFLCIALPWSQHRPGWAIALSVCGLTGFLRMAVAEMPTFDNYRQFLPRDLASAELQLIIRETPLLEGALAELDVGRGLITADILTIRTLLDDAPHHATGRVALTAADSELRQHLRNLHPGDVLHTQGALVPIRADDTRSAFYGNFLRSRGILHQFEVLDFEPSNHSAATSPTQRLRQALRRLRVTLAERLIRNIRSPEAACLALALGLGMSEFTPRENRQRQVVSGTIHVFAISGMHIGMVTLLLSLLLRWSGLPLGWQWSGLAICATGYVLLTGSSISSLRALWMVWLALYATYRFRRTAWLNTLGCAGLLALLLNPWQLLDLGFQYSHLTVLVLLLGAPLVQRHSQLLAERNAWLPRELRPRHRVKVLQWFVCGLETSFIAWLGNLGLAMHLAPQLSWGAPLLNLPLGLLVALALALCPMRLLLGGLLPHYDRLWAAVLELVLRLTETVAESGYRSAFAYTHPLLPTWAVVLYYVGFFTIFIYIYKSLNINKL
ncbi:MAG: ComEC/Rec2 family competence protein [Victivallales bacterium]|nr:ComEC/Rec2 family competence protein [Victivallales bacterium]